jgi:hypothetical protein
MKVPDILTLHSQVYLSQRVELCETCGETVFIRRQRVTGHPLDEARTWFLRQAQCVGCGALEEWVEEGGA